MFYYFYSVCNQHNRLLNLCRISF